MSRVFLGVAWAVFRFPRVSGDEPATTMAATVIRVFSPRERG